MTSSGKAAAPAKACKQCGKPGFAGADGKMQHERRGDPAAYGGRRADPTANKNKGGKQDDPPDREHPLNRRVFGGTGRTE